MPTPLGLLGLGGTRARIVELLRRSTLSANEIADLLGTTHNAVRPHLAALARAGLVREGGTRRTGSNRPTMLYELAPRAEAALSHAYIPFVAHLLRVLGERMSEAELHALMRTVGQSLASQWPRLRGDLRQRVAAAQTLLAELGARTDVEDSADGFVVRGYGCLLAEAVHGRPEVCRVVESLLAELTEAPVEECCERGERPRCCFRIDGADVAVRETHSAAR
jgi:predicted ArsR family transcriptional regulator